MITINTLIKNGTIITSKKSSESDILIKDEKISLIEKNISESFADEIIDAKGKYIFPGFIDTHVHSRDKSAINKEDFFHSTMAAAIGGITTIFEMPNSMPAIADVNALNEQICNLESKANVDFCIWGLCLGDLNNDNLKELSEAGVVAFKFFWGYSIDKKTYQLIYDSSNKQGEIIPPLSDGEVYRLFKRVNETGKQVAIHAENASIIKSLVKLSENYEFKNEYEKFLYTRESVAEESTISTAIAMARNIGCKLHILHLSSGIGAKLIRRAQEDGVKVSSETCPQYLFLDNEDYCNIGPIMKVYPPIRRKYDRNILWEAVKDGTISHICSDHAPHMKEEKEGNLFSIPSGMCGVETLAPLMINAVNDKLISMNDLSALLSENPAKLYGIYPQKGSLELGTDADITIVDFNENFEIKAELLHSKSKVTAFDGYKILGKPYITIVRGNVVAKDGILCNKLSGKFIKV